MKYKTLTIHTLFNNVAIMGAGLITSVLLSHWLGPAGRGGLAAALLWPMLLVYLSSMGLMSSVLYFSAQPDTHRPQLVSNAVVLAGLQTLIAVPLGYVALPHLLHSQEASVVRASQLFLLVIPASLLTQYLLNILQGGLHIKIVNVLRAVIPAFYLVGSFVLYRLGHLSVPSLVNLTLALNYVVLLCTVVAYAVLKIYPSGRFDVPVARRMMKYGFQVQIGDIAQNANLRLDQTLMAAWLPPAQLGLYVAAVSSVFVAQTLSTSVRTTATPTVAKQVTETDRVELLGKIFRKYWLLSLIAVGALALLLPVALPLVYGRSFRGAVLTAEVLLIGTLFLGARDVLCGGAQALGKPWIGSRGDVVACVITVVLLFLLLPRLGIMGAAITSVAAYGTELLVILFYLKTTCRMPVASLFALRRQDLEQIASDARRAVDKLLGGSMSRDTPAAPPAGPQPTESTPRADAVPPADAAPGQAGRVRLAFLDGLRGLSALYVTLYHIASYTRLPPALVFATGWLRFGHYAVGIFIVLSGYSLMLPLARSKNGQFRGGVGNYLKRRALRILPPYYAALALSIGALLLARHAGAGIGEFAQNQQANNLTAGNVVAHLLLLHSWSKNWNSTIDGPMWSVSVEWQIYFLFPLLLLPLWRRFGVIAPIVVGLLLGFVPYVLLPSGHNLAWACPWYVGLFAMGMAAAVISFSPQLQMRRLFQTLPWGVMTASAFAVFFALPYFFPARPYPAGLFPNGHALPWVEPLIGLGAALLILYCARSAETGALNARLPLVLRLFESRWAMRLGAFSYSLYLVHLPVVLKASHWTSTHFSPVKGFVVMLVVVLPLILVAAYLFHLLFERPFTAEQRARREARKSAEAKTAALLGTG